MLQAFELSCAVPGRVLLQPMSLAFYPGRVSAIVGPNGAGKSTLLSLLSGQRGQAPGAASAGANGVVAGGAVTLNGRPLHQWPAAVLARFRAFMLQDSAVAFDYTVRDVVELGRYPHRQQPSADEAGIVQAALAATGVAHLADRVLNTLSGGEKARAQLARALAQIWQPLTAGQAQVAQRMARPSRRPVPQVFPAAAREVSGEQDLPRWLLLDEPTAALDLAHQHQVMQRVRQWAGQQGVGVVAVVHDLNLALRYCDDVLVLADAAHHSFGPVQQVLTPALIQQVWGIQADRVQGRDGMAQYVFSGGAG